MIGGAADESWIDAARRRSHFVRRGHRDGTLKDGYNDEALAIALIGVVEALLRERLIARRAGQPDPFNDDELRAVFLALVSGLSRT